MSEIDDTWFHGTVIGLNVVEGILWTTLRCRTDSFIWETKIPSMRQRYKLGDTVILSNKICR